MSKKRRRRRPRPRTSGVLASSLASGLRRAESLAERGKWGEARELLESLEQRHPDRPKVLEALADLYYELNELPLHQKACELLLELRPDDPDVLLSLGGSYIGTFHPALALRTFRHYLDRWPDHERAGEIRKLLLELEGGLKGGWVEGELYSEGDLELITLHEETRNLLDRGEYARARQAAEELLRRRPDFVPALNNLSLIHFSEGRLEQAIAAAQRVLDSQPDNFHALSNLTHYLCLSGRLDEARELAGRLRKVESGSSDVWIKKAEAFSFLGDDQAVLEAFSGADQAGVLEPPFENAMLYHLAAVAAMRLGRESEARRYWQRALELVPGLRSAQENLDDLRRPAGERHGPWPFDLATWVPRQTLEDLERMIEPALQRANEAAFGRAVQRYLRRHPEMVGLVPVLLDRGDPRARELALRLAMTVETPEMLAALKDFALSQRGPDRSRMEAAGIASKGGVLPPGMARMWLEGEWRDLLLAGFEIHGEPVLQHSLEIERLKQEGTEAWQRGEFDLAERLLKQAIEAEPDAPDLLNNLASVYGSQGREEEAEAMVRQIHRDHPDYLYARITLAGLHIRRGELEEARAMLDPLLNRRRLHFTEFVSLCKVQIQLYLAEDKLDSARAWFDMWEKSWPDHPELGYWREQVGKSSSRHRFWSGRY